MNSGSREHWDKVYNTKGDQEVSWYQETPTTSLETIKSLGLPKDTAVVDVGGGNSNLAAELQKAGFTDLSVLDISEKALKRSKDKLGQKADEINWIVSDILDFEPAKKYGLWHDRATFHFLTSEDDVRSYISLVSRSIDSGGYLVLATFSTSGPEKCSGLNITQYSSDKLQSLLDKDFKLMRSFEEIHKTPFNTRQNFIYTVFEKN